MGARSPRPGALQPLTWSEFSAAGLQSFFLFWTKAGAPGVTGRGLGVGRRMSRLKKRKTTHHLEWAASRGRPLGIGREGQSRSVRPGGHGAGPAEGSAVSGLREPAWACRAGCGERGSQMAAGCAAQAGQRQGRGRARPRGSRTAEPGSIVVAAEGRGSKTASEAREAAPWSASRRVPGEAVMAAPWERGAGCAAAKPRRMG